MFLRSLAGVAGCVGLGAAVACGAPPPVQAPAADHLGAIRIEGNRAIAGDVLEPGLALHDALGDGAAVDPYLLSVDTERIRVAYVRRGFFAATVTAEVERHGSSQVVVFTVAEGPRAITRLAITGLPPEVSEAAARAVIELRDGAPFDYDAYDAAKQPLTALVENAGYARAEIRAQVVGDPAGIAAVHYEAVPGALCRFGAIRPRGKVSGELGDAALAHLRFATGDRYSPSAIAESQAEIYDLGRFSAVQIVPDRSGDSANIDVAVELVEASRHELHAGFGVGYEPITYEARVRGGGSLVPAAAPLLTLAADSRIAVTIPHSGNTADVQPKVRILGSLRRLDLWWPRLRGEVEGGLDYQTVEAYSWFGAHIRLGLGSPIGPRWLQARVGWLLEELTFSPAPEIDAITADARRALGLVDSQRIGAYQASLVADLRDDPIEPRRGAYLAVTAALGTPWAGGDLRYVQLTPELRGYVSLAGVVVAARVRVGQIIGDAGNIPLTERYYSGGTAGQRGFSERYLAPHATLDAPGCSERPPAMASLPVIGGAGLIETGIELRRQIATLRGVPVGANLFLDGADVTCARSAVDPRQLSWAVGVGVWGKLAGLKIRTDVGYRLNHTGAGELPGGPGAFGDFAWHLGVGETY